MTKLTTPTSAAQPARTLQRRDFLKSAMVTGAGLTILPSGVLSGANAPSNKLNIALIGAYGRAQAHYNTIKGENVVAICDVYEKHIGIAEKELGVRGKAKTYVDWRKCLEQKDIDAVVCCSTDHTHAFIANWAMNRGMHVYMEKPLANSVEEARLVRATYLNNRGKLATQVGTQRHALANFNRVRELVRDGAIGELKDVHAWGDRQFRRDGYPKAQGQPPKDLHWDLWIGPAPFHPYNPAYYGGRKYKPGMNCLSWNMFWDFGTGQVGDMGSHTMDLAWNALDGDLPTSATAKGEKFDPEVTPVELNSVFELPANDWRGPINVAWWQGGMMPRSPRKYVDLDKIGHGVMFKGTKGFLVADYGSRIIMPWGDEAGMTYYDPRPESELIPKLGNFQKEWIDAAKGNGKTSCDFDYGGKMIEMMLLGLVAYRVGDKIDYDGATGRSSNALADELMRNQYRKGWTLNG